MAAKRIGSKAPNPEALVSREDKATPGEALGRSGLRNVEVKITLELGRTEIAVEEALNLGEGALLGVDKLADEPVEVRVNGKLFGRGKLVLVGDHYGVQLTEVIAPPQQ